LRTLPDNEWRARLGATEAAYKRSVVMSKQEMNDKLSEFKRVLPPELRRSVDIADAKTSHSVAVKAAKSALKNTSKELASNLKNDHCAPKNAAMTLRASTLRCGEELSNCQLNTSGDAEAMNKCNHEAGLCRATGHAEKLRCRREHKEMTAEMAELKREAKAELKRTLTELKTNQKRKLLLAKRLFEYAEQPELRALDEARDAHLRRVQKLSESYRLSRRELAEESKRAACRAVAGASKECLLQCANEVATCAREARGDRSYQQGCVRDNKRCRVDCRKETAETLRRCNAEAFAVRARVKKKLADLKVQYRKQVKDADRQLASTLKSMRAQIKRAKGGGH